MTAWMFLAFAIALEVLGTFLLKLSDGFDKLMWGLLAVLCYSACFWVLAPALKQLPLGVVYAVWSGVGIVAAVLIGLFIFSERLSVVQILCIVMILIGAVGLRLTTAEAGS